MTTQPDKMDKATHLKLVEAWWDGELETNYSDGWGKSDIPPSENSAPSLYRIRPKPSLRPWKPEEVRVNALFRYKGWIDGTWAKIVHVWLAVNGLAGISLVTLDGIQRIEPEEMHEWDHSIDGGKTWKPCGVEESQ